MALIPRRTLTLLAVVAILAGGCATPEPFSSVPAYNRYSIDDIVAMSHGGEPSAQIIGKLESANGFYPSVTRTAK